MVNSLNIFNKTIKLILIDFVEVQYSIKSIKQFMMETYIK